MVELGFEKGDLRIGRLDLQSLAGDGFFGSFDAKNKAKAAPTTRSIILFSESFLVPLIPRTHLRAAQVDTVEEELESLGREGEGGHSGLGGERP